MDREALMQHIADICNKLQAAKTALDRLIEDKNIPKDFAQKAQADLDHAVSLLHESVKKSK